MARVERQITTFAQPERVWEILADLETVERWNPSVAWATCGHPPTGLGARRTCALRPLGQIDEIVSVWEPRARIGFAIGPHGAVRSAETEIALRERSGGTQIVAIADYHLSFGPLGPAVDRVVVRRQMARMLDASLSGLKDYVERPTAKEWQ